MLYATQFSFLKVASPSQCATFTVRNPLLLCPLVLAQDGGTRSGQKCLHRDFSATVLFCVIMLGEAIFDIKHDF